MSDAVLDLLDYDADIQALICLNASCWFALQFSAMWQHLRKTHCVHPALVQEIERYVKTLPGVCAPAQLPLRPNNSLQHRLLRLYLVF